MILSMQNNNGLQMYIVNLKLFLDLRFFKKLASDKAIYHDIPNGCHQRTYTERFFVNMVVKRVKGVHVVNNGHRQPIRVSHV